MSITIDNQTVGSATGNSLTFAHNNVVNSDNCLIVYVHANIGGTFSPVSPTGVTYNGVSMAAAIDSAAATTSGSIWYKVGATSGSNDVVITMDAGTGKEIVAQAISLNNVHQVSTIGDTDFDSGSDSSRSASLTGMRTDVLVIDFCQTKNTGAVAHTLGGGQTLFTSGTHNYELPVGVDYDSQHSYKPVPTGRTTTMTRSFDTGDDDGSSLGAVEVRSVDSAEIVDVEEAIDISETIVKDSAKIVEEAVDMSETSFASIFFRKDLTESLEITEVLQKAIFRVIEESVEITETVKKTFQKIIEESLEVTESVVAGFKKFVEVTESIQVGEWLRNVLNGFRVGFWTKQDKKTATWTSEEKKSTTWTKESKNSDTWTPQNKEL